MFRFSLFHVVVMAMAAAAAVLLFLFMLRRARGNTVAGSMRAGMKTGYILCASGSLLTGASIALFMVVRSKIEGVFFLFHSMAQSRSEPYRLYAVLMFLAGAILLGTGLINISHGPRKKGQP